jgi:hypothetical protein
MTPAPFLARAIAAAWPIPVPAPVIQATLLFRDSSMVPPYGDLIDIQTGRSPIIGIGIACNVFKK